MMGPSVESARQNWCRNEACRLRRCTDGQSFAGRYNLVAAKLRLVAAHRGNDAWGGQTRNRGVRALRGETLEFELDSAVVLGDDVPRRAESHLGGTRGAEGGSAEREGRRYRLEVDTVLVIHRERTRGPHLVLVRDCRIL